MEVKGLWDRELQRWVYPPVRKSWGGQISTERWAMRHLPWEDLGEKHYKLRGGNDSGMRKEMATEESPVWEIKAGKPENCSHSLRKKMHNSVDLNLHWQRKNKSQWLSCISLLPQCSMWKNMKISNSNINKITKDFKFFTLKIFYS